MWAGLCRSHARRLRLYGDAEAGGPLRTVTGEGSVNHGYWWVGVGPNRRHLVPTGRRADFEHRLVMAEQLGRPLQHDEVRRALGPDPCTGRPRSCQSPPP